MDGKAGSSRGQTKDSFFGVLPEPAAKWAVAEELRHVVLACYLCFGMRIVPRVTYLDAVRGLCGVDIGRLVGQVHASLVDVHKPALIIRPEVVTPCTPTP